MPASLLDTNLLIFALRHNTAALDLLERLRQHDDATISVITRAEILVGMRPHEESITMALLNSLHNLPVTNPVADLAGRLIHRLARNGVHLSFPDALIAATAITHDLKIITTNATHFAPTGAQVEPWTPMG
jgi:predicted nucleic acid-binding protein